MQVDCSGGSGLWGGANVAPRRPGRNSAEQPSWKEECWALRAACASFMVKRVSVVVRACVRTRARVSERELWHPSSTVGGDRTLGRGRRASGAGWRTHGSRPVPEALKLPRGWDRRVMAVRQLKTKTARARHMELSASCTVVEGHGMLNTS